MIFKTVKLATLLLLFPISTFATPMLTINESGQLTGASDIIVGGSLYDVIFVGNNSCSGLFNGCDATEFAFSTRDAAQAASIALLTQVFLDEFDTTPDLTGGCTNNTICYVATPYATQGNLFYLGIVHNYSANQEDLYSIRRPLDIDRVFPGSGTWAIWTPAAPQQQRVLAPEPGISLLLGLGLAGIAFSRRS